MNIHISGHNISVSDALRLYADKKFDKIKKHFNHLIEIHLIIKMIKSKALTEATIHISGHTFFATSENDDMYVSIDRLTHKLDRQIIKHKDKLKDYHPQHYKKH